VKLLIIDNIRAGQGDAGIYAYIRELSHKGCEVTLRPVTEDANISDLVRDGTDYDRVIAAGGDGTASAVSYALRDTRVPIVVYPAGTGNLLALNLRMPLTPVEIADVTLNGVPLLTDIGEITCKSDDLCRTVGFVNAAGCGFDASIMDGAKDLKPVLGVGAYFVGAMQNLTPTVSKFTVEVDGDRFETEGIAVMLVNFAKMLFDLTLAHDSSAHDGEIEIVILRTAFWAALQDRIVGDHPGRSESLEIHRGRNIKVSSEKPLPMQYDGELMDCTPPFEGRVLPDAATFVVPSRYLP